MIGLTVHDDWQVAGDSIFVVFPSTVDVGLLGLEQRGLGHCIRDLRGGFSLVIPCRVEVQMVGDEDRVSSSHVRCLKTYWRDCTGWWKALVAV